MYVTGKIGDRYRIQGPIIAFNALLALVSLSIVGWVNNTAVRYFAIFPLCMGSQGNLPSVMAYQANNIRGQWKRAFCSASLISMGGLGGIIGSLVFRSQDAPRYYPGLYSGIVSQVIVLLIVGALTIKFIGDNKKVERGELRLEGSEDGFKYTL
jgi:hypothetical protein